MIRAFDTLTKNFDILQKRQENISSNMANSQTTGYQSKQLFQQTLREVEIHNYQNGARLDQRNDLGTFTFGNEIGGINLNMEKGAFEETVDPLILQLEQKVILLYVYLTGKQVIPEMVISC